MAGLCFAAALPFLGRAAELPAEEVSALAFVGTALSIAADGLWLMEAGAPDWTPLPGKPGEISALAAHPGKEGRLSSEPGPAAFFSDYNCPNCELVSEDLLVMEAEAGGIHLRRHEWPILGQSSETSARAAIAAGSQGARDAFNRRLQGTAFEPTKNTWRSLPDRLASIRIV